MTEIVVTVVSVVLCGGVVQLLVAFWGWHRRRAARTAGADRPAFKHGVFLSAVLFSGLSYGVALNILFMQRTEYAGSSLSIMYALQGALFALGAMVFGLAIVEMLAQHFTWKLLAYAAVLALCIVLTPLKWLPAEYAAAARGLDSYAALLPMANIIGVLCAYLISRYTYVLPNRP